MKKLPLLLLMGLLFAAVPLAFSQSAEEMVSNCKGIAEAKVSGDQVVVPSNLESGICWGAFASFDAAMHYVGENNRPFFGVCEPSESTRSQMIKIFIAYAERHPDSYHKDFFLVALLAGRETFPCRKQ